MSLCPEDQTLLVPVFKDRLEELELERYRIYNKIGAGGWSHVYRAEHKGLNKVIALKVLHEHYATDAEKVMRFQKEALAASSLQHPNIAAVQDYGLLPNGQPFIAMDYVTGTSLADKINECTTLSLTEAIKISIQICNGLAFAHERGFVHRDLKPGNIMIAQDESGQPLVKILDFGLAKLVEETDTTRLTKTGDVLGTPAYMSPEQCKGQGLDHRSDLYSLGCVIYELVTGHPPFQADTALDCMIKHYTEEPPPMVSSTSDVTAKALEIVVLRALQKRAADRYNSAMELRKDLLAVLDSPSSLKRERAGNSRRMSMQLGLCVLATIALALTAVFYFQSHSASQSSPTHQAFLAALGTAKQNMRVDHAMMLVNKEIDRLRSTDGALAPQLPDLYAELGLLHATKQEDQKAIRNLDQAIKLKEAAGQADDVPEHWLNLIGELYQKQRRFNEVLKCIDRITTLRKKHSGENSLPVAKIMLVRAENLMAMGRMDECRKITHEASTLMQGLVPVPHSDLAAAAILTASSYGHQNNFKKATQEVRQALQYAKQAPADIRHCNVLDTAGEILAYAGELDKAVDCLKECCSMLEDLNGPDSPVLSNELRRLGRALAQQKKYDETLEALERALAIKEKIGDRQSPEMTLLMADYEAALKLRGKDATAMRLRLESLRSMNKQAPPGTTFPSNFK